MDEVKFQNWNEVRKKGFGKYFLKYVVFYFIIFSLLTAVLNFIINLYSPLEVLKQILGIFIIISCIQTGTWFYREKKYKEYLNSLHK